MARPGYQRARERTLRTPSGQAFTAISRILNTATGGSSYERGAVSPTPERLRYLAETAGGGVLRELEKAVDTSSAAAAGDKVKPYAVPIFGRFYGEVDAEQVAKGRYYDRKQKIDTLQNSMRAAKSAGDGEAMLRMIEQHPVEADLAHAQDQVQRRLSKLNRLAASTVDDRETMRAIDQARLAEMQGLNEAFEQLEAQQGLTPGQRLKQRLGVAP